MFAFLGNSFKLLGLGQVSFRMWKELLHHGRRLDLLMVSVLVGCGEVPLLFVYWEEEFSRLWMKPQPESLPLNFCGSEELEQEVESEERCSWDCGLCL